MINADTTEYLLDKLEYNMSIQYEFLPNVLGYEIKQFVGRVNQMVLEIYTNDHNPPHFHVKSKDKNVNARFKIEDGSYMDGSISSRNMKRIEAFYNDCKEIFTEIWDKRNV